MVPGKQDSIAEEYRESGHAGPAREPLRAAAPRLPDGLLNLRDARLKGLPRRIPRAGTCVVRHRAMPAKRSELAWPIRSAAMRKVRATRVADDTAARMRRRSDFIRYARARAEQQQHSLGGQDGTTLPRMCAVALAAHDVAIERLRARVDRELLGPRWREAPDSAGRLRLEDPTDFVRLEIAAALARDIRVVPVLVDDAQMLRESDLPPDLQLLASRNAFQLSSRRCQSDLARVLAAIDPLLANAA